MGKVTVYQCDSCGVNYNKPSEIIILEGNLCDGDGNIIQNFDGEELFCIQCFIKNLTSDIKMINNPQTTKLKIQEKPVTKDLKNYILLRKICDEKDESDFIHFIGHTSRDGFEKIYNSNLINHYYPIEFDDYKELTIESFNKEKMVPVINKVFASVPQVTRLMVTLYEQENLAIVDRDIFEE